MPADFHEVRFPLDVSLGSRGGPVRRTDVVTLSSGREHRNSRWAGSRRRYDAGLGVRSVDALHAVVAFFEERRGRLIGSSFAPYQRPIAKPVGGSVRVALDGVEQAVGSGFTCDPLTGLVTFAAAPPAGAAVTAGVPLPPPPPVRTGEPHNPPPP